MYVLQTVYFRRASLGFPPSNKKIYRAVFESKNDVLQHIKSKKKETAYEYSFQVWKVDMSRCFEPVAITQFELKEMKP